MKIKYILFILLISVNICAQTGSIRSSLSYPEFIPVNSSFDISLITSAVPGSDTLLLNIKADQKIQLSSADLISVYGNSKLDYTGDPDNGYKLNIDLSSLSLNEGGIYFQILTTFKPENLSSARIQFDGIFIGDGTEKGNLSTNSSDMTADLYFFKPYKAAGKSFIFKENSLLTLEFGDNTASNLLTEFWLKILESDLPVAEIVNRHTGEINYNIVVTPSQMITVESGSGRLDVNPIFLSKRAWNFISILVNEVHRKIEFYCNDILFFSDRIPGGVKLPDLIFMFRGKGKEGYQINNLRLIDLKEDIDLSSQNKHRQNFRSDSSKVIAYFNNDKKEFFYSEDLVLDLKNTSAAKSDAPIYPEAPELNISMHNRTIEINWTGGDYKKAAAYVLERSFSNSYFIPVFSLTADRSDQKIYTFIDNKDETKSVVYYRLKQINIDGSFVYSTELKVGFGVTAPFSIQQNFPNPFNPKTSIAVDIIEDSDVEVKIYNLEGELIISLYKGHLQKGIHRFEFDAAHLPSGIYLCKVSADDYSEIRKMILAK